MERRLFDGKDDDSRGRRWKMGKPPCLHGDLCRAYMRRFGRSHIYAGDCPTCEFYTPREEWKHFPREPDKKLGKHFKRT